MFCHQCQETARNQGCTVRGVCGKTDDVATLQDLLIHLLKGVAFYGAKARELGARDAGVDAFVARGLFATLTNVDFDPERFMGLIDEAVEVRRRARAMLERAARRTHGSKLPASLPDAATWAPGPELASRLAKGREVGILATGNEDVRSLRSIILFGLKGMGAYAHHAEVLGRESEEVYGFILRALAATLDDSLSADALTALVLEAGEKGVAVLKLLDEANTAAYGTPVPTEVPVGARKGPAILVSGHDLRDLEELLAQTEGTGIGVYTHGEMLPAHGYPRLKRHEHLAGHWGAAWHEQRKDFEAWGGAILMTTNCLVEPKDSYRDRLFTTGLVGWPGVAHVADRQGGKPKDFSAVITRARSLGPVKEVQGGKLVTGFGRGALAAAAPAIVDAVKAGKIRRFVVMAGCDGRFPARAYYTEVARKLPPDAVILTAGCAKFRYNALGLGNVPGTSIPRVVDAGQCNDSYSLAVTALALAGAFGAKDVNELPLSFDIAWYEQKAVLVLLALLSLGVKGIRLGPTLPGFLSPGVAKVLVERFGIRPIATPDGDVAAMMEGR